MKSNDEIVRQKEKIISKHPYLLDVIFKPLSTTDLSIKDVAAFIDNSWKATYKAKERFIYDDAYLKWVYGIKGLNADYSLCAYKRNKLIGLFLFTPRIISYFDKQIKTGIESSLSILPTETGNGLAQMIFTEVLGKARRDLSLLFVWFHKSFNHKFSSYQIQKNTNKDLKTYGNFNLNVRVLDYKRAVSNSDIFLHEKALLKIFSKRPKKSDAKIEIIDNNNMEECLNFANNYSKKYNGRLFTYDEFCTYVKYEDQNFKSMGAVLRRLGKISCLMVGYPINITFNHEDKAFILDYFIPQKSAEFPCFEGFIKERFDIHTILSLYPFHGIGNLFLPTRNVLSLNFIEFNKSIKPCSALIIDHK